jgi:hypothetical protein
MPIGHDTCEYTKKARVCTARLNQERGCVDDYCKQIR